jgi:uncharacterized protein (DUF2236 family)
MAQVYASTVDTSFLPFAPDSAIRRVGGEGVLLLGGGRALLMQIAHPLVAKGVAEHSNFRADRRRRLLGTLRPMFAISFGAREQALAAAASVNHMHARVTGAGYRASDPDLLVWVLATLIDTSLFMYERFVSALSPEEASAYYEDMCRLGSLLSVPKGAMPPNLDAFQAYVDGMIPSLIVTEEARSIYKGLFGGPLLLRPLMSGVRVLTAGLLPRTLREQFGLTWGPNHERLLQASQRGSRLVLPRLPRRLRAPPWFLMPGSAAPSDPGTSGKG